MKSFFIKPNSPFFYAFVVEPQRKNKIKTLFKSVYEKFLEKILDVKIGDGLNM